MGEGLTSSIKLVFFSYLIFRNTWKNVKIIISELTVIFPNTVLFFLNKTYISIHV